MIRNFSGQLMLQSRKIAKARLKRAEMAELRRRYAELCNSEITIQVHRGQIMGKNGGLVLGRPGQNGRRTGIFLIL
jgi:hypothetical protein